MKDNLVFQKVAPRKLSFVVEGRHHLPKAGVKVFMGSNNTCLQSKPTLKEAFGYSINYTWIPPQMRTLNNLGSVACPCSVGI